MYFVVYTKPENRWNISGIGITLIMKDHQAGLKRLGGSMTFSLFDLDRFKEYNDRYGHEAGDEVLYRCIHTISELFKRETDLPFRVGGKEFTIVTENVKKMSIA